MLTPRKIASQLRDIVRGLGELLAFAVACVSAVALFLMGRWPEPVILGSRDRKDRPR